MHKFAATVILFALAWGMNASVLLVNAQAAPNSNVDNLKKAIEEKNKQIEALNAEIKEIGTKIQTVGEQKKSLQTAVNALDTSDKKLSTEVKVTESKIEKTALTIDEINLEIAAKERKIAENQNTLSRTIRSLQERENQSLLELYLATENISDFWDSFETLTQFQTALHNQVKELSAFNAELASKRQNHEQTVEELSDLKDELIDKKEIVAINKKEKSTLLTRTKSEEAAFQKLLAEKKKQADAFAREIFDIESQIKIAIDPSSFPPPQKGLLAWPVDNVRITQYYGLTEYSSRLYNSGKHNGLDFGAPVGTPVKAISSGVVEEVGDTDAKASCAGRSYGKWVFIRHSNGLASVYGHMSLIKAKNGQVVNAGDIIGYVGQSGYAFGAHLHVSLFASQGVNVTALTSTTCGGMRIPVATPAAYLDPYPYF